MLYLLFFFAFFKAHAVSEELEEQERLERRASEILDNDRLMEVISNDAVSAVNVWRLSSVSCNSSKHFTLS